MPDRVTRQGNISVTNGLLMLGLESFEWEKHSEGYRLIDLWEAQSLPEPLRPIPDIWVGGPQMLPRLPEKFGSPFHEGNAFILYPNSSKVVRYRPFERSHSLFREFADLDFTDHDVKRFADRHGVLFGFSIEYYEYEDTGNWFSEIHKMKIAVKLFYQCSIEENTEILIDFFNKYVFTSPCHKTHIELSNIDGQPSCDFHVVADNLISAIWLQFALAAAGDREQRKCQECPTWFEIAPGTGRPEKVFCSDACRMRAYRQRKGVWP